MLISKNLPDAEIPEIGPVSPEVPGQYVCEFAEDPWPLVLNDGALVAFYRFDDQMHVQSVVKDLEEGELQLYRVGGEWYGAFKAPVNCDLHISRKDLLFGFLGGAARQSRKLDAARDKAVECLRRINAPAIRFDQTPIWTIVEMDCTSDVPRPTGTLKSNISVVQTSEHDFSQVLSISNVDMIPMKEGIVDPQVIRYISIIRPPRDEEKRLKEIAIERTSTMRMLAPKETAVIHVHTVASDDDAMVLMKQRLCFVEFNLVIQTRESLDELKEKEARIRAVLSKEDVSVYTPTNGQRQQFVAMLPGLASQSETMHLATKSFVDKVLFRMLDL